MDSGRKSKDFGETYLTALTYIVIGLIVGIIIDNIFAYLAAKCQMKSPFVLSCVQLLTGVAVLYVAASSMPSLSVGSGPTSIYGVLFVIFYFLSQQNMVAGLTGGINASGAYVEYETGKALSYINSSPEQEISGISAQQANNSFESIFNADRDAGLALLAQIASGKIAPRFGITRDIAAKMLAAAQQGATLTGIPTPTPIIERYPYA